jgi:ssRNA-specific RNase YbeY (16S rRNA maturation enzyme)
MEAMSLTLDLVLERPGFDPEALEALLAPLLPGRIELVLADPGYMRVLNMRFRHIDRPTDVLAFDLRDDPEGIPEGVIYVDGRLYPPLEELLERIFHGYLHLAGRTHNSDEGHESMRRDVASLVARSLKGSDIVHP